MSKTYCITTIVLLIPEGSSDEDFMDMLSDYRDDHPQALLQWDTLHQGVPAVPRDRLSAQEANRLWEEVTGDDSRPAPIERPEGSLSPERTLAYLQAADAVMHDRWPCSLGISERGNPVIFHEDDGSYTFEAYSSLPTAGGLILMGEVEGPSGSPSMKVQLLMATHPDAIALP